MPQKCQIFDLWLSGVFQALNTPKLVFRQVLHPGPRWGSLRHSPRTCSRLGRGTPLPIPFPSAHPQHIPGYAYVFVTGTYLGRVVTETVYDLLAVTVCGIQTVTNGGPCLKHGEKGPLTILSHQHRQQTINCTYFQQVHKI